AKNFWPAEEALRAGRRDSTVVKSSVARSVCLKLMECESACVSVVRRGVEGASSSSLFFYAKEGLAHVFEFAARREASERQDVIAGTDLRGRKREDKVRARSGGLGFDTSAVEYLFAADRLQHKLVALVFILSQ